MAGAQSRPQNAHMTCQRDQLVRGTAGHPKVASRSCAESCARTCARERSADEPDEQSCRPDVPVAVRAGFVQASERNGERRAGRYQAGKHDHEPRADADPEDYGTVHERVLAADSATMRNRSGVRNRLIFASQAKASPQQIAINACVAARSSTSRRRHRKG